jgi:hypothetical protein
MGNGETGRPPAGHPIHLEGCRSLFQVELVSPDYHPAVAWLTCLQTFTIPASTSSYPVLLTARYYACSQGPSTAGLHKCLEHDVSRPLPHGEYRARLYEFRPLGPAPRPSPST